MPAKSRSKSKSRRKKKGASEGVLAAVRWDVVGRAARPVALGVGVLSVGLLAALGLNRLSNRAADELGGRLASNEIPVEIIWPALPGGGPTDTWMPAGEREALVRRARAAIREPDPLSVRPLRAIATALGESGWFEGEPAVNRDGRGRIVVQGDWRVPAAVVRYSGWDHLVSWTGMPMPRRYAAGSSNQRVIIGARLGPGPTEAPAAGYRSPWPGEDVAAGLRLLRLLAERDLVKQVEGIDVSSYPRGMLELVTIHGTRIEWGAAPGEWTPGQATDEERIARLLRLQAEYGRIDGGAARVRIAGAHVERVAG
jgi:hypothetical protein